MSEFDADKYRERPTAELTEEQQLLEMLKSRTFFDRHAWWEWNAEEPGFTVSQRWEDLTGYKASEIFPQNLSSLSPTEPILDLFAKRWLALMGPDDRATSEDVLKNFLLFDNGENYLKLGYHLRLEDGSYRFLMTEARSVWKDNRLTHIFAETMDIDEWMKPESLAITAVQTQAKLKKNTADIKTDAARISALAERLTATTKAVATLSPVLLALFVALTENSALIAAQIKQRISLFLDPPKVESTFLGDDKYLLSSLSDQAIEGIEEELKKASARPDLVQLAGYSPETFPESYKVLIQAKQGNLDFPYSGMERSTAASLPEATRTERHLSDQPYIGIEGLIKTYAVPLTIINNGGEQRFFVEATYPAGDPGKEIQIRSQMDTLSASIQMLIQDEINND